MFLVVLMLAPVIQLPLTLVVVGKEGQLTRLDLGVVQAVLLLQGLVVGPVVMLVLLDIQDRAEEEEPLP
jgi:hypothetical protein